MTRIVLTWSGVLFLGAVAAFLLFVPPLWIGTAAMLWMGFMLMFALGLHLETQSMLPSAGGGGTLLAQPAEIMPGTPAATHDHISSSDYI